MQRPEIPTALPDRNRNSAGFTLMEVALSIAVVAVGVMALFALMSSGLESSAEALADTQSAIFADNVFSGLRGESARLARAEAGDWEFFWDDFKSGDTKLTVAVPDVWVGTRNRTTPWIMDHMTVKGDGKCYTNIYVNKPLHGPGQTNIIDRVLRYQMLVEPRFPPKFSLPVSRWGENFAKVTLKVWKDQFGSWKDEDAIIYYAEINNPGDL